ncbi:MAG: outer membrane protein assembly factor BamB family protein [Planctomycetota bacterium]|jgi:hypothetical protein
MGRIVGVLLLFLPAYVSAGEGEVRLPVDDDVSQDLALARKHVKAGAWTEAAELLRPIAALDPETVDPRTGAVYYPVHSDDGVHYYPVGAVARRRLARMPAEIRKTLPKELLAAPREGPVVHGPPRRVAPDLPETLPREPLWSFRLSERDRRLWAAYGQWLVRCHDRQPAVAAEAPDWAEYPTVRPVVSEGAVLYRDYVETVARRLGSGTMLPLVHRYDPLDRVDVPNALYPVDRVRPNAGVHPIEARKWQLNYDYYDYGGNSIALGEGMIVLVEQRQAPRELLTLKPLPPRPNLLVAYSRASGKTVWAWHLDWCARSVREDEDVYAAWQTDHSLHPTPTFFGPGVIAGGLLYTVAQEENRVSLWALNAHDGRVRFRTLLHFADETHRRLPRGTAVAVADGAVFVVTQAGVVAAVDARPPGRRRWLRRYARETLVRDRGDTKTTQIRQTFAYQEPLVADGKLIVAATDARELLALDTRTGRTVWAQPRASLDRVAHVVGLAAGRLVLAGKDVIALDVETGEKAWGPVTLKAAPYGRGFVGGRYVHVPSRRWEAALSFVERFELATGTRAAPLFFDVVRLGNLSSVDGRLIAANDDRVMCFATCDAELKRIDARLRAEGSLPDLWCERAQLSLAAQPPRRAAARRDFRIALEAARRLQSDDRQIRADALANLFALVRENGDRTALAEAHAVVRPMRLAPTNPPGPHPYAAQIALLELSLLPEGEARHKATLAFVERYGQTKVVVDNRVVLGVEAVK